MMSNQYIMSFHYAQQLTPESQTMGRLTAFQNNTSQSKQLMNMNAVNSATGHMHGVQNIIGVPTDIYTG
eukprot:12057655-Ditylum_brightwellii.AAC.1